MSDTHAPGNTCAASQCRVDSDCQDPTQGAGVCLFDGTVAARPPPVEAPAHAGAAQEGRRPARPRHAKALEKDWSACFDAYLAAERLDHDVPKAAKDEADVYYREKEKGGAKP